MLTHLKLDNFKIWKSTGPMRLAPVTLLLGTNSSGKSSLIQSLLLIRQTVKGDDPNLDLNLGNPDAGDSVTAHCGSRTGASISTRHLQGNSSGWVDGSLRMKSRCAASFHPASSCSANGAPPGTRWRTTACLTG